MPRDTITTSPQTPDPAATEAAREPHPRRAFLLSALAAGLGAALAGCAQTTTGVTMPGPEWPQSDDGWPWTRPRPGPRFPEPPVATATLLARADWTKASPYPTRMDPMLPARYVTVHHSAGPLFRDTTRSATVTRLESIRRFHTENRGWGDIGYHYAVDRAGRVWECRSLHWQGAHVSDHNEHNIGIVVLGDFDRQRPTQAQVAGLTAQVRILMSRYRIPESNLRTHKEWAVTACPGRSLQGYVNEARARRAFV